MKAKLSIFEFNVEFEATTHKQLYTQISDAVISDMLRIDCEGDFDEYELRDDVSKHYARMFELRDACNEFSTQALLCELASRVNDFDFTCDRSTRLAEIHETMS